MPFYYQYRDNKPPNKFVATLRRVYQPLGFKRGYSLPLWAIFAGAAFGFCVSRAMYLDYDNTYKRAKWITGDWEYQSYGRGRVGLLMHLICVVPIGLFLPWQFLPVVRYKCLLFHRLNGYLLLTLLLVGNVGAVMIMDRALGGSFDSQVSIVILAIATIGSALLAYINIKRLQIDQHRAWMLRCWSYAFVIITQRIIQIPMWQGLSRMKTFYVPMSCHTIDFILNLVQPDLATSFYPQCDGNPNLVVSVLADFYAQPTEAGIPRLHEVAASTQASFAAAGTVGFLIHFFGVELYLHLTQAEANRLKRVSRDRQLERGWNRPGDASWLTKETWGDVDEFDYQGQQAVTRP